MNPENNIPEKLLKPYEHKETESRIYKAWEESGFFNPDKMIETGLTSPDAKPFTIVMPPPNVTGVLHMGHGLMLTVQDIMIRYKRMNGFRTLWIPGTDHAAIATQSKVEKEIQKKEGLSRHDLGRDELLRRVNEFAQDSHDTIVSQVRKMGSSCDWSREAFTLDSTRNKAVNTVFKMMYDDGLIYRGHRIVNWDPKGQTTIADDEIVYEERKGKLYTFKYSPDFPIAISTTRPETKVGDVAVAVHPSDERYKEYVGKTFENIEFCGAKINIKVIADESVEKDFGTGALGVTPAHSMIDWEIADRHDLPRPQVINEYAKMVTESELLNGKKVAEAREIVVSWLRENNLLEKEEDVNQNIGTAERTGGVVEPLPKLQWFINVNKPIPARENKTLKEIMREAVAGGGVKIIPEYFDKTYFNWIDNLRDWCISRQIWYGHRVPVWYPVGSDLAESLQNSKSITHPTFIVSSENPGKTDGTENKWVQDPDTLDTWFSSGMWTFSTLGWPEKTKDLEIYHPTDVLETGYEILFFWVARMIMMTGYTLNTIPFHTVYLNGTVRDGQGRKMSKSLGNGIDPVEVADKFGADAGRMALIFGSAPGIDSRISDDKIKGQRNFANKVWNIARFVLSNTNTEDISEVLNDQDKKIREEFDILVTEISKEMDDHLYHVSAEKIYGYVWNTFASTLIEESKTILSGDDEQAKKSRKVLLRLIFTDILKILHPFMPYVTEEIWNLIGDSKNMLMVEKWPSKK
ncbi:valine--tRNA ligase [Candidatus Nomurabacteria bacterium]|nr:MAG: valine--tRNA ligase [Candidatus Nomurabacteria bacterium]